MNVNNKIILPFNEKTSFNHTPMIASLMGMLESTCGDLTYKWFFNNFYSMCFSKNYYQKDIGISWLLPGQPYRSCELIEKYHIPFSMVIDLFGKFQDFLKYIIQQGYYVLCDLDSYFIPGVTRYQKYHVTHDTFINGFIKNESGEISFCVSEYFSNDIFNKFSTCIIDGTYLDNAFNSVIEKKLVDCIGGIAILRPLINFEYHFNKTKLKDIITDYINGNLSNYIYNDELKQIELYKPDCKKEYDFKSDVAFGLDCYKEIVSYLKECYTNNSEIDCTCTALLQQHCAILAGLISFLRNNKMIYIKNDEMKSILEIKIFLGVY